MSRRRDSRSAPLLGCLFAASLSLGSAAPAASETAAPPSDRRLSESTTLQFTFSQIRQTDISVALGRLILYDAGGAERGAQLRRGAGRRRRHHLRRAKHQLRQLYRNRADAARAAGDEDARARRGRRRLR